MKELYSDPYFGMSLSLAMFFLASYIQKKIKLKAFNPLLFGILFTVLVLLAFDIPLEDFNAGGDVLNMFLSSATIAIGYSIYNQWEVLKKYSILVLVGCTAGGAAAVATILILGKLFNLDETLLNSLFSKSVTTPIAVDIAADRGGIVAVAIVAVIITGISSVLLAPALIKIFKIKNKVAIGTAMGTCGHALGTSLALEMGETEGATSGIAIGAAGLITVILSVFL